MSKLPLLAAGLSLLGGWMHAAAEIAPLSKEVIADAMCTDDFSLPTPGELMAALDKQGKLDWTAKFRAPISTSYPTRAQLALNLGSLVADGFIAVEAEDSQQVKNLGKDIIQLAKNLGVSKDILMRGASITDFAERKQWEQLKEELEATQNEVKEAMRGSKDSDLVTLVSVGCWLRGAAVISGHLAEHYTEAGAKILRQPAILAFMNRKLANLPPKMRDDPKVKEVREKMLQIEMLVNFPRDKAPTLENLKVLSTTTSDVVRLMAKKETK